MIRSKRSDDSDGKKRKNSKKENSNFIVRKRIIFDDNKYKELDADLESGDPLVFEDTKKYTDRIVATQKKSGLKDAVATAYGKTSGNDLVVACMDISTS